MTEYVILRETETGWENVGTEKASGADAAIRAVVVVVDANVTGTYVAIPARSFKPQTVRVETQTRIRFGEGS